jgi:ribosomal protection tetracycline resistance protein
MRTLNLGILAHVDAGKTTLTERILFAAGGIARIGSVDEGTTQTDTLALERERGITIRSAVASFAIGDVAVNLIDTPGHPDFIAEVERTLTVLDGAVLVVSAVEGVQAQTPLLMRALQRLRVPTLLFVNKIDRPGADDRRTLAAIARRLTPAVVPMAYANALGTRDATAIPARPSDPGFRAVAMERLAENDDGVLATYVGADEGAGISDRRLIRLLSDQTRRGLVHPVFVGSAITGEGVPALMDGIAQLLPPAGRDSGDTVAGRVFKIERSLSGERSAYVRLYAGTLDVRDRVRYGAGAEGRVTALATCTPGGPAHRAASAGDIAKVSGLTEVRVGDVIGDLPLIKAEHHFAPPTLESVVVPRDRSDGGRLRAALVELAEQDPLINVRQDEGAISVSLYGEVQKEVIGETLSRDYGVAVDFLDTTAIHVERLTGTGEALEVLSALTHSNVTGKSSPHSTNPFLATLGLRVEPNAVGSGIEVRLDVDVKLVPLYIYKTVDAFLEMMTAYVTEALDEGLLGWNVPDAVVTIFDAGYRAPETGAGDFHKLTALVLKQALARAGTEVFEPVLSLHVEVPADDVPAVLQLLGRSGSLASAPVTDGDRATVTAVVPARVLDDVQRRLPGVTSGEGVLESRFSGYRPVTGRPPTRRRAPANGFRPTSAARAGRDSERASV